jgi:signal transduction histidine kinase
VTRGRLRLVFCGLALLLALPAALLVRRALASVALEREARERAVAERAFDEMERVLSELLREEEARAAGDYDFARADSPLRERPADSFALGWFQIEADESVTAPPWAPRAAEIAREVAADGARFEAAARKRTQQTEGKGPRAQPRSRSVEIARPASPSAPVGDSQPAADARRDAQDVEQRGDPVSDSTAGAAGAHELQPASPQASPGETPGLAAPTPATDAYDALAKLNTGAKEREERKQRVYVEEQEPRGGAIETPQELVARALAAEPEPSRLFARPAPESKSSGPPVEGQAAEGAHHAGRPAEGGKGSEALVAERAEREADAQQAPRLARAPPLADSEAVPTQPGSELVRVVVDPMRGRLASGGELLLLRSAWIGGRGVRQGVVLDVRAIERALADATLATGALPGAQLVLTPSTALPASSEDGALRRFSHRFAEPFDPLTARLAFPPFADDSARSVHWLAVLFALAGAGGLLALYRMTALALHFAERRSNFAAAVSHELKTPLTAIRLYAEMLRDGLVSGEEKRREYYGSITAESERLSRLINNVLEFSKLEKGARTLAPEVGDVAPVLREATLLLRSHACEHGVELELAIEESLPPVRFERDALTQIVFNLIDNAIKYGRGERARVDVSCGRSGDGVALTVRDHGAGVPREELARIQEPFYRRGDELTRRAQGAGIGLALVRSLAREMGAAFHLANAEGGGLVARIELVAGAS